MQKSENDGLPKISAQVRKNKRAMLFIVLVMVVVIGFYFNSKAGKEDHKSNDESYVLDSDAESSSKEAISGSIPAVADKAKNEEPASREDVAAKVAYVQKEQQELQLRLSAPMMLVGNGVKENDMNTTAQNEHTNDSNSNIQPVQNPIQNEVKPVTAVKIKPLSAIIAEGNFIHAILESAIQSDLPGSLRAIVSEPVFAEDGSRILIPRGSRLIGEYKSGIQLGQSRIFVVWSRLITPEGVSVQLNSAGVDSQGVAGMTADSIDRHFWERFGTSSLLSMLGAGSATLGTVGDDQDNSASAYRTSIANSFTQSAHQSLQQEGSIRTTLRKHQGQPIIVFVARDLQFESMVNSRASSINIF